MNTAFILAIIVLGALSAALGAMLAAARREAGHLRADKTAAEQARLQAEADINQSFHKDDAQVCPFHG